MDYISRLAKDTTLSPEKEEDFLPFEMAECNQMTFQGGKGEILGYIAYLCNRFPFTRAQREGYEKGKKDQCNASLFQSFSSPKSPLGRQIKIIIINPHINILSKKGA